jgi:SAM-dependent methyltransferase
MSLPRQSVRLHLGCGKRYLPGWIHIDLAAGPHIDFQNSIDDLSMFANETVDVIYCSHALEYFDRVEASEVLAEWRRVLTPGGRLFLAVPDFRALIRIYEITGNLSSILGPLYGRMSDAGTSFVIYHKTVYDLPSLESMLSDSGFTDISQYDPIWFLEQFDSQFDDHSLAFFPHMDRRGIQVSLCVSAIASQ